MIKIHNLKLPFDHPPDAIQAAAARTLGVKPARILSCRVIRRSLDARARRPLSRVYTLVVQLEDESALAGRFPDPLPAVTGSVESVMFTWILTALPTVISTSFPSPPA